MRRILLLLICGLVPSIWAECTERNAQPEFERSLRKFSVNLLARTAREKEYHFVISPLTVWTLLTSTWLGAANSTKTELIEVLGLHKEECYTDKYLSMAIKAVAHNNSDVIVERKSKIYVDSRFRVNARFRYTVTRSRISSFGSTSFEHPDSAAQKINDYVRQATHNRINQIVSPENIDPTTVMIIIDSIYFKGGWQVPFQYNVGSSSVQFYSEHGDPIGTVNSMFTERTLNCGYVLPLGAKVLELPYGNDKKHRYSMLVFLPDGKTSLKNIIENLKTIDIASLKDYILTLNKRKVYVQMPRFKISSDISNLKQYLIDMGLKAMFDEAQASFPIMSDELLFVSNIIQKADIVVTEKGTEASAATGMELSYRSMGPLPYEFIANKPFLFMIVDMNYNIPIFVGAYSKPSEY